MTKMKSFIVDAPGKVILFGEHAVVHGKKAIATAIDLRTSLSYRPGTDGQIKLDIPDLNAHICWKLDDLHQSFSGLNNMTNEERKEKILMPLVKKHIILQETSVPAELSSLALLTLMVELDQYHEAMHLTLKSALPIGAGLGSSAAMSVCFSTALLILRHKSHDISSFLSEINQYAFMAEQIIHGTPSGIDNTVSTYGGAIEYVRCGNTVNGFASSQWSPIPAFPRLSFLLIDTKVPRNTKTLVDQVHQRLSLFPDIVHPILNAIHEISEKITSKNWQQQHLPMLLSMNHDLLNALGVGHPSLEKVRMLAHQHGFPGMKLTGAGGGGCCLVFLGEETAHNDFLLSVSDKNSSSLEAFKSELKSHGFRFFSTLLGAEGVRVSLLDSVL